MLLTHFSIYICSVVLNATTAIIGLAAGIIGTSLGLLQYRQNSKIKRAQVLTTLFEKFYENESYKKIREWIDQDSLNSVTLEKFEDAKLNERDFEQKFSDYLNFFQLIVSLHKLGQLKKNEISFMYNYYLKNMQENPFVRAYLLKYGYTKLDNFLKNYKNAE